MLPKLVKGCLKYCHSSIALSRREGKGGKLMRKSCIQRNLAAKSYNLKKLPPIAQDRDVFSWQKVPSFKIYSLKVILQKRNQCSTNKTF